MWFDLEPSLVNEALASHEAEKLTSLRHASVTDPVPSICTAIAARIRQAILAGGRCRLQGGPSSIPQALRAEATAILRFKLLVRFALSVTDERKAENDAAEKRIDDIAAGVLPFVDESAGHPATPPPTYHGRKHRWQSPRHGGIM